MLKLLQLPYVIEVSIIIALGNIVYFLCYAQDKYFVRNRVYLLLLTLGSFLLPLVSLPVFAKDVVWVPIRAAAETAIIPLPIVDNSYDWMTIVSMIYFVVVGLLTMRLLYHIGYIITVLKSSEKLTKNGIQYVITDKITSPSSIFNFMIVDKINLPQEIVAHEKVHIDHKHTYDVLFLEIAKIVLWFNPFIYLIANALKVNHEYTADHLAAQSLDDESEYSNILIQYAKSTSAPILLNTFSAITKKRIIMLSKKETSSKWKSLWIMPLFFGVFSVFSCDSYIKSPSNSLNSESSNDLLYFRIDTIVTYDYDTEKEFVQIEKVYPNDMRTWVDTTVIFNSDTGEEKVQVVKSESPRTEILLQTYTTNEYLASQGIMETKVYNKYPQELVRVTDTIVTFNLDTYEEKTTIVEGSRAREELMSIRITPKDQIKEGQKFDNILKTTDKVITKRKG